MLHQAKFIAKKNHDIQVKNKLWGSDCWLREVFRLIVAAMDEIGNTVHDRNVLDQCLTYFKFIF